MINEKIYQMIYDELRVFFPEDWKKIVFYSEYGENSYSYSFYVATEKEWISCYDLPGINEEELLDSFDAIDDFVSEERNKCLHEKWSNMTMIITDDGHMKAEFDYTDLSGGNYEYKKEWKKKYIC